MPRVATPLTATEVKNAKPGAKLEKLFDGGGLYLEVPTTGAKRWRFKFRHLGKENRISLGVYPDVSLADARVKRDELRALVAKGIDPSTHRRQTRHAQQKAAEDSFETVAAAWLKKFGGAWAESHRKRVQRLIERDLVPGFGRRPVHELEPYEILTALRKIEGRGAIETAHRGLQVTGQVMRYAVASQLTKSDPTRDLRGALQPRPETKHFASLKDPKAIGELLRAIDSYMGDPATKAALQLAPLTIVRPNELRRAEWSEVDLDAAVWTIGAHKMKGRSGRRREHIVPLSTQAVEVLRGMHPISGTGQWVFPGARSKKRPISDNTVLAALRRMGFDGETMTGHGFRSMASTLLNEQGWNPDAIERQLAHVEKNAVRRAYNAAQYLPERRKMLQAWADYLDELRRA